MTKPIIATVELDNPFKILAKQVWVKAENRTPPAAGNLIAVKAVQASDSDPDAQAGNLINRSGLLNRDGDNFDEHGVDPAHMWRSAKGGTSSWLEFDLGEVQSLGGVSIFNYNDSWHTDQGVRKADISIWTQETGWKKIHDDLTIDQAEGTDDYDEPTFIELDGVKARKIRLDDLAGFGDAHCVGLSEVQFFTTLGPQAVRPSPTDGAETLNLTHLVLTWTPGAGATAHDLYFGADPQNLQLLGRISGGEAKLSRVADQTKYYWRVDEVQADGSVVRGTAWSFTANGLLAWWKLDESEGQTVADSSPYGNGGVFVGNPKWQPTGGRIGGALEFDGAGSYVQIDNEMAFDMVDEVTVAAWVKVRVFDKTWQTIIAKGDNAWRLAREWNANSVQFTAGGVAEGRIVRGAVNINDGQWHHIVGVGDANAVSLYVDGVLDRVSRTPGRMTPDDEPVLIGENSAGPARGRFWNGWIDDVRVFRYALDANEVKALYSGTEPTVRGTGVPMPHLLQATRIERTAMSRSSQGDQ
ncbi:MAG: LamG-like jellyroll fold domain-containing protein [Solirubrobacterales bacterium]